MPTCNVTLKIVKPTEGELYDIADRIKGNIDIAALTIRKADIQNDGKRGYSLYAKFEFKTETTPQALEKSKSIGELIKGADRETQIWGK